MTRKSSLPQINFFAARMTVSLIGNSAIYQVITGKRHQVGVAERRAFDNRQRIGYEITSSDYEFVFQPRDG
jgi:hypothetical protein